MRAFKRKKYFKNVNNNNIHYDFAYTSGTKVVCIQIDGSPSLIACFYRDIERYNSVRKLVLFRKKRK
jgi:hypothetical protein